MILSLLIITWIGWGLLIPLSKRPKGSTGARWALGLGMAGMVIGVNWLSYTKNVPTKPFLGMTGFAPGFVPLLASLPFWLYQPWQVSGRLVLSTWKPILVVILSIILLSPYVRLTPSPAFMERLQVAKVNSVISSYGSGWQLTRATTTGGGVETVIAYLGSMTQGRDESLYPALLILSLLVLGLLLFDHLTIPVRLTWRHAFLVTWIGVMIALKKGLFMDILPLLLFIVMGAILWEVWAQEKKHDSSLRYIDILAGVLWAAMLAINPTVCLWIVTPLAAWFVPKKMLAAWVIAILVNPLMIGGWL